MKTQNPVLRTLSETFCQTAESFSLKVQKGLLKNIHISQTNNATLKVPTDNCNAFCTTPLGIFTQKSGFSAQRPKLIKKIGFLKIIFH